MTDRHEFRVADQLLLPWSPKRTISTSRAAEALDVSIQTVCRLIEEGALKAYKVRPGTNSPWRVSHDSLMEYCERIHVDNGLEKRF